MLNKPEIMFIILGLVFAIISGLVFPSFAVFTGELLDVSIRRQSFNCNYDAQQRSYTSYG